ncbi:MAG: anthranilate synthase component I family protein, partial [Ginsengibacter sp.]
MLNFGKKYSTFCFLDNHEYNFKKSYDCIAGAGVTAQFVINANGELSVGKLDRFLSENNDWIFGHISYDLKNEFEDLYSSNPDGIDFPILSFFVPEVVFIISNAELRIGVFPPNDPDFLYKEIMSGFFPEEISPVPILKSRFSRNAYIKSVRKLQEHILKGDCYEINFCQEFYATKTIIDPVAVHKNLSKVSPNPFSAFYKYFDKFLMCASPERFLKKRGDVIISQPIKGTARRIEADKSADDLQKKSLSQNEKERAENIMIVDMVRNDLAKICSEGSVKVEDYLGVYTFPQVHQMISTISGILKGGIKFSEILNATFPMGSMTGAPKKRVMELIEEYEKTKRGLFSGSVGYINPEGDFDFNVVIRSIQYNARNKYLSIMAGSA